MRSFIVITILSLLLLCPQTQAVASQYLSAQVISAAVSSSTASTATKKKKTTRKTRRRTTTRKSSTPSKSSATKSTAKAPAKSAAKAPAKSAANMPDPEPQAAPAFVDAPAADTPPGTGRIHKVLFIGDSMTGWMAERLNAYGKANGFDVAAVIWDGSTIKKWGTSDRLADFIRQQKPDAVFISLGLNELFVRNPESTLKACVDRILHNIGNLPYLWIGPPTWPGKPGGQALNSWLEQKLGPDHFFNSSSLTLPRQSATNPHPSRAGINTWMDAVATWIPSHTSLRFASLNKPTTTFSRPGYYLYRKMKENL